MATQTIQFFYLTGIKAPLFTNARLQGSWDASGQYSDQWSTTPMTAITGEDGCPAFSASIPLDESQKGKTFNWGVIIDGPGSKNNWGINMEVNGPDSTDRSCSFTLARAGTDPGQQFYLTSKRRLGANKIFSTGSNTPGLQFSVWAPHALQVSAVFGTASGYIGINGQGIDPLMPVIPLQPTTDGCWKSAVLPDFSQYEGKNYMYRILNAQNQALYRTDIFARGLEGRGSIDPENAAWDGTLTTLDGTVSCSIITDPDTISAEFPLPVGRNPQLQSAEDFWEDEFNPAKPL